MRESLHKLKELLVKERVEEGLRKEVGVGALFCKVSNVEGFESVLRVHGGRTLVHPSR